MWVFALLLVLPLIEISLFVTLGAWMGLGLTLAIVVGSALFGILLIRRQGDRARADLRAAVMTRANPGPALASDALAVVSGVLLILPGFFTDALGLLLLAPPVQRTVIGYVTRRARMKVGAHLERRAWDKAASMAASSRKPADVIDGTWEELPDGETPPRSGWTRH